MRRNYRGIVSAWMVAAVLLACAAAWAYETPTFVLRDVLDRDQGIAREADWRAERIFEGIGWKLGTVSRGDGSVMKGGFTVVRPAKGQPFTLKHCYVLAAYDLLPRGILLVTVRDPQLYWKDYDYEQGITDPVELVWYDDKWQEQYSTVLDYAADEYPDDFRISPDEKYLVSIRHPLELDGKPAPAGHALNIIYFSNGSINDLWLPEIDGTGQLPASWWPVLMEWGPKGTLTVQAGKQVRVYEVQW